MSRRRQTAEEGLGKTPVALKDPKTAQLLHAYGEHIDLVIDNIFRHIGIDTGYRILRLQMDIEFDSIKQMQHRPLQRALLAHRADCHCSPFSHMAIRSVVQSGSVAEGLATPPRQPKMQTSSDADLMIELGPVRWDLSGAEKISMVESDFAESVQDSVTGLNNHDADTLPRLAIVETENPGFVLLMQERRSDCPHEEMLPFKAEAVNQFMSDYQRLTQGEQITSRANNGPASSYTVKTNKPFEVDHYDGVPCLHVPVWWFSEEFFTRHRQHAWPPEAVMNKIKQFGLHLVPVGAAGSKTENHEWRLSFSMAEVLIAQFLTETQRCALIAFKLCREDLGEEAKVIKSYYIKTALLWLCERTPKEDWTSISRGVLQLVDFLLDAVNKVSLPCYFWSEINLFRSVCRASRRDMKKALDAIRKHVLRLAAHAVCTIFPDVQPMIVRYESRRLAERQVRIRLARWVIKKVCVDESIRVYITTTQTSGFDSLLPVLSRSWSRDEVSIMLKRLKHWHLVQKGLLQALTVVPDDVASQVRLSDSGDGGFVWDAAPLLAVLTDEDMKQLLLGDPEEVRAWLRRQHQRPEAERPPGLPADLRSPRDRCDLLLNTPLLCRALRESIPVVWTAYERMRAEKAPMVVSSYRASSDVVRQCGDVYPLDVKHLVTDLRTKLNMDVLTAMQIACRVADEALKQATDPEAVAERSRVCRFLPDYWGVWHFVLKSADLWMNRP